MKEILKYVIWAGLAVLFIVPFIVSGNLLFPYITGKAFVFRITTEAIFAAWLILAIGFREYRPKISAISVSVFLFSAVMLLADIFSVNPSKSFWSNYERMDGFVTIAHLLLYFIVLTSTLNKEKLWVWFWRINVVMASFLGLYSISNSGQEIRYSGPLGNPIYLGCYFLFIFFISLWLWYKDAISLPRIKQNILTYLYPLVSILSFFIVYRTSRGVLIGLFGGLVLSLLLIAVLNKKEKVIRLTASVILIVMVILSGTFVLARGTDFVKNNPTLSRLAEVSWENVNGQARQYVWPMAIKGFKEKPILGWGQESFNYVFNKYYDTRMYGQEQWFDRAHNSPLDFLVSGGLLGLIAYLSLYLTTLYIIWFRKNSFTIVSKSIITGLLAGYAFQSLFVFDNLTSYMFFIAILAFANSVSTEGEKPLGEKIEVSNDVLNYVWTPIIIIILLGGIYILNYKPIMANRSLIQALANLQANRPEVSLQSFKEALSYQSMGNSEIREQLFIQTSSLIRQDDIKVEIKNKFVDLTTQELAKQITETPSDARYYYFMANFMNNIHHYDQAVNFSQKALELSPNKITMRLELARSYLGLQNLKEASALIKDVYNTEPRYEPSKRLYDYITDLQNKAKI